MTHRIFTTAVADVYPHYVTKVEKKGRTQAELNHVIAWLTGYPAEKVETVIASGVNFQDFFNHAPALNPKRELITGSVCGIKVQEITDPLMQLIRYLDKLVDELAKGKALEKVLRT